MTTHGLDRRGFEEVRERLIGRTITRIETLDPASADPEDVMEAGFTSVRMAVELTLDDETNWTVAWAEPGQSEALLVGAGRIEALRPIHMELTRRDRSADHPWSQAVNNTIVDVGARWQIAEDGVPPTPWMLRFTFARVGLVVALGELTGNGPTYMPDELVATFDRQAANGYSIPAAIDDSFYP